MSVPPFQLHRVMTALQPSVKFPASWESVQGPEKVPRCFVQHLCHLPLSLPSPPSPPPPSSCPLLFFQLFARNPEALELGEEAGLGGGGGVGGEVGLGEEAGYRVGQGDILLLGIWVLEGMPPEEPPGFWGRKEQGPLGGTSF